MADANASSRTSRSTAQENDDSTWDSIINSINKEIEEAKAKLAFQRYSDRQRKAHLLRASDIFDGFIQAAREQLHIFEKSEEKWNANLRRQLGDERAKDLISQGIREKVVHAIPGLAISLGLDMPVDTELARKLLLPGGILPRTSMLEHQPSHIPSSEVLTPPAREQDGPSALKRPWKESQEPEPTTPSRPKRDGNVSYKRITKYN